MVRVCGPADAPELANLQRVEHTGIRQTPFEHTSTRNAMLWLSRHARKRNRRQPHQACAMDPWVHASVCVCARPVDPQKWIRPLAVAPISKSVEPDAHSHCRASHPACTLDNTTRREENTHRTLSRKR